MTAFYVDNGVTTSGNGLSWSSAWKSFANINWSVMSSAVAPTLYISGGTYYERLYPQAGGQAGNVMTITVGANAPDPVGHDGLVVIDGQGTLETAILLESQASYMTLLWRDVWGAYKLEIRNMAPDSSRPVTYHIVQAYNGNHLTIDGIRCPNATRYAISMYNETNGVVRNCYVDSIEGAYDYSVEGFYFQYVTGCVIENNVSIMRHSPNLDTTGLYGDAMQIFDGTDVTVRNNYLAWKPGTGNRNCGGLMIDAVRGNSYFYNNVIIGNSFNPSEMFQFESNGVGQLYIVNNTCIAQCATGSKVLHINNAGGDANIAAIKNNIFYTPAGYCMVLEPYITPSKINNNCLYTTSSNVSFNQSRNRTWRQHQSAGYDVAGINADPLLDTNYRLRFGSPCINVGADLSTIFTTDRDGNLRPAGAWDVGACEYIQPKTTVIHVASLKPQTLDTANRIIFDWIGPDGIRREYFVNQQTLKGYSTAEQLKAALDTWTSKNFGYTLTDVWFHRNDDGTWAIATGQQPVIWPEDGG